MKKLLLSGSALLMFLGASAQMASGGDGFTYDNTSGASNCLVNSLPSNGGVGFYGGSFTESTNFITKEGDGSFLLQTESELASFPTPLWFFIHETTGEGEDAQCTPLGSNGGVDMSSQSVVTILAKASSVNDTLEFFLASGTGFPQTSTYNIGDGSSILARHAFEKAGEYELFTFDFASIDADVWDGWAEKNAVHQIGFRSATAGATFNVLKIGLGSSNGEIINSTSSVAKASVSVYPNPATDVLNVSVGAGNANVQLSSVTGAVVASANGSGNVVLSTSTVPAGLYVVTVNSASGTTTSKVVIK